jgi:hypothetical protein
VNIQYVGFHVSGTARTYNFHVTDAAQESREFAVKVKIGRFGSTALKYQQGPEICLLRLRRALEGEGDGSCASSQLEVVETDIRDYLERRKGRRRS